MPQGPELSPAPALAEQQGTSIVRGASGARPGLENAGEEGTGTSHNGFSGRPTESPADLTEFLLTVMFGALKPELLIADPIAERPFHDLR